MKVASSGVGGIGVSPGPSRATIFWVRALLAGPVPPQLLANRSAASTSETRTKKRYRVSAVMPVSPQAASDASDFTVTRGEVMSPL